jgi:hypothetical protein
MTFMQSRCMGAMGASCRVHFIDALFVGDVFMLLGKVFSSERWRVVVGTRGLTLACMLLATSTTFAGPVGVWDFAIQQPLSGLAATTTNVVSTSGTLIGNYDETTNPTGTRTKPGLFGTFGATENVSVNVNNLGASLSGALNTRASGGYRLTLDTSTNTVVIENYTTNFLANGAATLPISVSLSTETFRTRTPSSLFPAIPITLPIGSANLTQFGVSQVGASVGTLTPTGVNTYDFTVGTLVNLQASFDLLGNEITLPGQAPVPFALTGSITISGNTAVVNSLTPIDVEQSQQPTQTLPQFPLALPTLTGDPANVLLDLTLNNIGIDVNGTLTSVANGVLVPSPGVASVVGMLTLATLRRRRAAVTSIAAR